MKTQNTKLNFKKDSIVELNENELQAVNGGTTIGSIIATIMITKDILNDSIV